MKNAVIIAGIPGTGKTTLMKNIIESFGGISCFTKKKIVKLIPSMYNEDENLHILGLYDDSDDVFQGTDRLSMACQPEFSDLLNSIEGSNVLFEGDRLLTHKTIDTLHEFNYNCNVITLETTPEELNRRYEDRGSEQNKKFIQGRQTKIDRIATRFDLLGNVESQIHMDENDTKRITERVKELCQKQ